MALPTELLSSIQSRSDRISTKGGVLLASDYVSTVRSCLADGRCSTAWSMASPAAWEKTIKDAESRLVYRDEQMSVLKDFDGKSPDVTPGACLDFVCVVTATKKDRDGDVLESKGAELDPSMPLLWQHIPLQPCGRIIQTLRQTDDLVIAHFAVIDSEFGRDIAKMIDFKILRISHGFKPLDAEPLKRAPGSEGVDAPGWHIKRYEIMEASVVSIPSNTEAIILGSSQGKFHHPIVKDWAKKHFDARTPQITSGIDTATLTPPASPPAPAAPEPVKHACTCGNKSTPPTASPPAPVPAPVPQPPAQPVRSSLMSLMTKYKDGEHVQSAYDLMEDVHDHPQTVDMHKSQCKECMAHLKTVANTFINSTPTEGGQEVVKPTSQPASPSLTPIDTGKGRVEVPEGATFTLKGGVLVLQLKEMSQECMGHMKSAFGIAKKMSSDGEMHKAGKSMCKAACNYMSKAMEGGENPEVSTKPNPGATSPEPAGVNADSKRAVPATPAIPATPTSLDDLLSKAAGHLICGEAASPAVLYSLKEALDHAVSRVPESLLTR